MLLRCELHVLCETMMRMFEITASEHLEQYWCMHEINYPIRRQTPGFQPSFRSFFSFTAFTIVSICNTALGKREDLFNSIYYARRLNTNNSGTMLLNRRTYCKIHLPHIVFCSNFPMYLMSSNDYDSRQDFLLFHKDFVWVLYWNRLNEKSAKKRPCNCTLSFCNAILVINWILNHLSMRRWIR